MWHHLRDGRHRSACMIPLPRHSAQLCTHSLTHSTLTPLTHPLRVPGPALPAPRRPTRHVYLNISFRALRLRSPSWVITIFTFGHLGCRRSLTARLHDCSTTAGSPCPGLPPGASRPQPVSLSHTRPCTPHDATGHAQHGCRLRRLRTATPLSTVYHGGWSNAPPRQAGSARLDISLTGLQPQVHLGI